MFVVDPDRFYFIGRKGNVLVAPYLYDATLTGYDLLEASTVLELD
jgi:hypothetical protein